VSSDFQAASRALGLDLDETALQRFATFRDRLLEASQRFNLTAVRDPAGIETRHFLESLAFGKLLHGRGLLPPETRVLDLGAGAGFPGIPLQIAWPAVHVGLLDSLSKRCEFLRQMVAELALDNASVIEGRAEDLGREPDLRESFDLIVARAVAPLPVLLEYALPFLRPDGVLAATKGSGAARELAASAKALSELSGQHIETVAFRPPEGNEQSVILVRKVGPITERYPRRSGVPGKRPVT
jgi:16S rRNA (guanine527-N7)-methyltransferase